MSTSHPGEIADIKGIWVASDTAQVVDEVRAHASKYFPNVELRNIVSISNGVEGGPEMLSVPTFSENQVRYWQERGMFTMPNAFILPTCRTFYASLHS